MTLEDWLKNNLNNVATNGKMSATIKPQQAERDKLEILSKEKYRELRQLADLNGIALSGIKNFDGSPDVYKIDPMQIACKK